MLGVVLWLLRLVRLGSFRHDDGAADRRSSAVPLLSLLMQPMYRLEQKERNHLSNRQRLLAGRCAAALLEESTHQHCGGDGSWDRPVGVGLGQAPFIISPSICCCDLQLLVRRPTRTNPDQTRP
jgi:hypothetical protein